jgi:cbb3-type cytochrome oxidase maturation protein
MSVLWILVGFSTLVAAGFLAAYLWAVRSGQFDDKHTPSVRILFEDQKFSATFEHSHPKPPEGTAPDGDAKDPVR